MNTLSANLIKKGALHIIWFLFFSNAFACFVRIPVKIVVDVATSLFFAILLLVFLWQLVNDLKQKKVSLVTVITFPFLFIPLLTAIQANVEFGQPYLYGFMAQRQVFMILCAHFIVTALNRNWISIKDFEKYLVRSLYVLQFIFLFFYVFVDPAQFLDTEFVTLSPQKGFRYEFPDNCIFALCLYALFKFWIEKKYHYLITVGICLWYILAFLLDRTQLIAFAATVAIFVFRNFNIPTMITHTIIGLITVLCIGIFVHFIFPDLLAKNIQLYIDAYDTLTGNRIAEASTQIRFLESQIAWEGFTKHPWLGNGFLSTKWNEGFRMVNRYFFPSDVGLLGNFYVYGIIGTLVFYIPFIYSFKWRNYLSGNKEILVLTSQYTLLFLFLDMMTAASNQKFFGVTAVVFGIIYYYRYGINKSYAARTP